MKLKEITIEITQQCPNYCIHCSSMSSLSKNHMMPLEKVKELIDDVDILGCEQISFSGGEPFLHKDLVKMVAYALSCTVTSTFLATITVPSTVFSVSVTYT